MEWSGSDHFSVAVEFEQADTAGHHHAKKEIQVMSIEPPNVFEEFELTVLGSTGGNYIAMFVNPLFDPNVKGS